MKIGTVLFIIGILLILCIMIVSVVKGENNPIIEIDETHYKTNGVWLIQYDDIIYHNNITIYAESWIYVESGGSLCLDNCTIKFSTLGAFFLNDTGTYLMNGTFMENNGSGYYWITFCGKICAERSGWKDCNPPSYYQQVAFTNIDTNSYIKDCWISQNCLGQNAIRLNGGYLNVSNTIFNTTTIAIRIYSGIINLYNCTFNSTNTYYDLMQPVCYFTSSNGDINFYNCTGIRNPEKFIMYGNTGNITIYNGVEFENTYIWLKCFNLTQSNYISYKNHTIHYINSTIDRSIPIYVWGYSNIHFFENRTEIYCIVMSNHLSISNSWLCGAGIQYFVIPENPRKLIIFFHSVGNSYDEKPEDRWLSIQNQSIWISREDYITSNTGYAYPNWGSNETWYWIDRQVDYIYLMFPNITTNRTMAYGSSHGGTCAITYAAHHDIGYLMANVPCSNTSNLPTYIESLQKAYHGAYPGTNNEWIASDSNLSINNFTIYYKRIWLCCADNDNSIPYYSILNFTYGLTSLGKTDYILTIGNQGHTGNYYNFNDVLKWFDEPSKISAITISSDNLLTLIWNEPSLKGGGILNYSIYKDNTFIIQGLNYSYNDVIDSSWHNYSIIVNNTFGYSSVMIQVKNNEDIYNYYYRPNESNFTNEKLLNNYIYILFPIYCGIIYFCCYKIKKEKNAKK